MRSLLVWFALSSVLLAAPATPVKPSEPVKPAPKYQEGSCCDKAAKKDAACAHPCCVKAAKVGKVCDHCNEVPKK